jgi:diguanylate cyclase (GGDEF)-like protein
VHPDLISSLQSLMVLILGADSKARAALVQEVDAAGHRARAADSAGSALGVFREVAPDVVLICVDRLGDDDQRFAASLREADGNSWTPIIFVSPRGDEHEVWLSIEAGGDDHLVSPVAPMILQAKLRAMQRLVQMRERLVELAQALHGANAQLHALATVDALTGLLNRRALDTRLRQEMDLARRSKQPLSIVLCDVDFFKRYNDSLGHGAGDACLKQVANVFLQACRRPSDCAARYGGEEFALILPNTPTPGAWVVVDALRAALDAASLPHPNSEVASQVTLSGGLLTIVPDSQITPTEVLERADQGLYEAKALGRNRIVMVGGYEGLDGELSAASAA